MDNQQRSSSRPPLEDDFDDDFVDLCFEEVDERFDPDFEVEDEDEDEEEDDEEEDDEEEDGGFDDLEEEGLEGLVFDDREDFCVLEEVEVVEEGSSISSTKLGTTAVSSSWSLLDGLAEAKS